MRKLSIVLLTLFFSFNESFGQTTEPIKRNFSYLELGGAGLFFSVNYERQLTKNPGISIRAGIGGYSEEEFYLSYTAGLAYLFALNKNNNSFIDLGLNFTLAREYIGFQTDSRNADIFENLIPSLSYRKHFTNDLFLKGGLNLVFNQYGAAPWLNLAIGKRF